MAAAENTTATHFRSSNCSVQHHKHTHFTSTHTTHQTQHLSIPHLAAEMADDDLVTTLKFIVVGDSGAGKSRQV